MRIAYFLDSFPTISETFVLDEINEISEQGVNVSIFSLNRPRISAPHQLADKWRESVRYRPLADISLAAKLIDIGCLLASRPSAAMAFHWALKMDSSLRWRLRLLVNVARELLRDRVQHLHAHFASEAAECAWCLSKLTGIPFSVTTHRYDIIDTPFRYYSQLAQDASFVRTISAANVERLCALGVPRSKVPIIHCGVRTQHFCQDEHETRFDVVAVGSLIKRKGHQVLIEAVRIAADRGTPLRVGVIGSGPELGALEALISRYRLETSVSLLGSRPHEEVRAIVSRARIFALPSYSEGISVAAMEAMAAGAIVVASDIEGMCELIESEVTGYLFPVGNANALAETLVRLRTPHVKVSNMQYAARAKVSSGFNLPTEVAKLRTLIAQHTR